MPDNKRQHATPEFYLEMFADSDGKVWVRDLQRNREFKTNPLNIAVDSECYTIIKDGVRDTSYDDVNKKVEDFVAPILKSLLGNKFPSKDERTAICIFTANLLVRSRRTRDRLSKLLIKVAEIAQTMAPILDANPLPPSIADLFGMKRFRHDETPDLLRHVARIHHPITVSTLGEMIAHELATKGCELLVPPPEYRFITADDPVVVIEDGKLSMLRIEADFISGGAIEVILPLKPTLACHWRGTSGFSVRPIDAAELGQINSHIIVSAYTQVYSSRKTDFPLPTES